jgi:dCTP deaminase
MLLSHSDLARLTRTGVIDAQPENVNAASIDIRLGDTIMLESPCNTYREIDLESKEQIKMIEMAIPKEGYRLKPGEFVLCHSVETFNLPNWLSAEYTLKSSLARSGLEHLTAGWCDAGWNGSNLTMEFKNMTQYHTLVLKPGMKIGQMKFFKHAPVSDSASYATRGQYNKDRGVSGNKGLR